MISTLVGFILGLLTVFLFRPGAEEERDLNELLESISPEQLAELRNVLTPEQATTLRRMLKRREEG
jgi:hypothetical protein